jgi:hypothetical protein
MWLSNTGAVGVQAWDGDVPADSCRRTGIGVSFPEYSCNEHLYGAGPIIGAYVNGVVKVTEGYNGSSGESFSNRNKKILHAIDSGLPRLMIGNHTIVWELMMIMMVRLTRTNSTDWITMVIGIFQPMI